jgi:hypothetical protein
MPPHLEPHLEEAEKQVAGERNLAVEERNKKMAHGMGEIMV